jgi:uncharacterized protein
MKTIFAAFFSALLFGLGLGISGMTLPSKVIGFLDVTGAWDPSLMFVMVGAISVNAIAYIFVKSRSKPVLTERFHIPSKKEIDWKLIVGAAMFGIGWGIGGFCPGPAIVSLVTGDRGVLGFFGSMIAGIVLFKLFYRFVLQPLGQKRN